jgi:hypothetical protein
MIEKATADEVVRACVAHLFSLLGERGRFVYRHRHLAPEDGSGGYNMLRHCGTVWFMCKAIRELAIELTLDEKQSLGMAIGYIGRKIKEPPWMGGTLPTLCLTSKDLAKLGGSGLAALMMREFSSLLHQIDSESMVLALEDIELQCIRLENYLASQLYGGDFIHKRAFSTGEVYPFRSDYYTGEALFALMQSPRQIPQVRTAMEALLDRGYGLVEQSHWMAYATCTALRVGYCDEAKIASYVGRLIDSIVSDERYRERHQSTPIACRTEALLEILRTRRQVTFLREHLSEESADAAKTTAMQNLSMQLEYYAKGQFRHGRESDRVQIDYLQHNGASFLAWWQLQH